MNQGPDINTNPKQQRQSVTPTSGTSARAPSISNSEKEAMQYVMTLEPSARAEYLQVRAALQTNPEAAMLLDQLLVRQVGVPPHSAALDKDHNGKTLLSSLVALTRDPLFDSTLDSRRAEIVTAALENLVHPEHVTQSRSACCTVTNALRDEARKNPAEYMMMLSDLVRHGGTQLRDGSPMKINESSIADDFSAVGGRYMARDIADRILQSSAIEFGNGEQLNYHCGSDSSSGLIIQGRKGEEETVKTTYAGLFDHQFENFLESLTGRAYRSVYDRDDIMRAVQSRKEGTYVNMSYASKGEHANHSVKIINEPNQEPGWIYYENPWGPVSREDWQRQDGPVGRELVDPARGIERIRVSDARNRIFVAFVDDARATRGVSAAQDQSLLGCDLNNQTRYGPTGFDYQILGSVDPQHAKPVEKKKEATTPNNVNGNDKSEAVEASTTHKAPIEKPMIAFPTIGLGATKNALVQPKRDLFDSPVENAPVRSEKKVEPQQSIYFSNERDINSTRVTGGRINAAPGSLMAAAQRVRFSTAA